MVKVSTPARWALRLLAVGYVFFLVAWPTGLLAYRTFQDGLGNLLDTLQEPDVQSALQLTGKVALDRRADQPGVRRDDLDPARPLRVPGQAGALGA